MGFTCDGPIFQTLNLAVVNDGGNYGLYAYIYADDAWDDAKAEVTVSIYGKEKTEQIDPLCAYVASGSSCNAAGEATLDLTPLVTDYVPEGMWSVVSTVIAASEIEITVEQDGAVETCTKGAGSIASGYQMASSPAKTTSFAIGAVALVGLAAYAMKRRNRATSKTGADEKLYGGELA